MQSKRVYRVLTFLQIVVGPLIAIAALVFLARAVDWRAVGEAFARTDGGWIAAAVGSVLVTLLLKGARWYALLGERARSLGLPKTLAAMLVGQAVNTFVPGRWGEIARIGILAREKMPLVPSVGSIVVEKACDGIFTAGVVLLLGPPTLFGVSGEGLVAGALGLAILLGLIAWRAGEGSIRAFAGKYLTRGFGADVWGKISAGLAEVSHPKILAQGVGWTFLAWIAMTLTNVCVFRASGLDLSAGAAVLVVAAAYLASLVPGVPGRVGTFHFAVVATLDVFAVPFDAAVAVSIVLHLVVVVPLLAASLAVWAGVYARELFTAEGK